MGIIKKLKNANRVANELTGGLCKQPVYDPKRKVNRPCQKKRGHRGGCKP